MESRANHPRQTPLSRLLDESEPGPRKATPLDALDLARKKWLAGERLDIGRLASELGVGRATLFRWVGSRENLYGEVCSTMFAKELERARSKARGQGLARFVDLMELLLRSLSAAGPLRRFVAEDPEFALRVLTSRASPVQHRCTLAIKEMIEEATAAGHMEPALPADELAYIIVRITESFLYRDVLTGDVADIEAAIRAIRVLLEATPAAKPKRRPTSRR